MPSHLVLVNNKVGACPWPSIMEPQQYRAMLCTINLCCAQRFKHVSLQRFRLVSRLEKKNKKNLFNWNLGRVYESTFSLQWNMFLSKDLCYWGSLLLKDIGPLCAPWSTTQVAGVQRKSLVHNVVLYHWGAAQCSSHKPSQTHRQLGPILLTPL